MSPPVAPHFPSGWHYMPIADHPAQPWKNGGGLTRELRRHPETGAWRWRLSVAEVAQDGPFSAFPGVQRWFVVWRGAGVELTIDGQSRRLGPGDPPLGFDGSAHTHCRLLDGPTTDVNLMLQAGQGGCLVPVAGTVWLEPQAAPLMLLAGEHGAQLDDLNIPPQHLAWGPVSSRMGLHSPQALLIHIDG